MAADECRAACAVARVRVVVAHRVHLQALRMAQMVLVELAVVHGAVHLHFGYVHFLSSFRQTFVNVSLRRKPGKYPKIPGDQKRQKLSLHTRPRPARKKRRAADISGGLCHLPVIELNEPLFNLK
jgi:hypothetical protein